MPQVPAMSRKAYRIELVSGAEGFDAGVSIGSLAASRRISESIQCALIRDGVRRRVLVYDESGRVVYDACGLENPEEE